MFCSVPHGIIHMGGSRILTSTVAFLFTKAKGIWLDLWHNSAGWRSIDHTAIPYREVQGKPCNQNREPTMRTGFPCNESRFFPVGIDLQGKAVSCTGFGFTVLHCCLPTQTWKPNDISGFLSKCSHKESSFFLHIIYLRRTVFLFVENTYTDIRLCHMHTFRAQGLYCIHNEKHY